MAIKDDKPPPVICRKIQSDHPYGIFYGQNPLEYSFPLMLLELSSLIIISRLVRYVLKPLRQPKVVSEIIGGIIMGPSVLGHNKKFREYMFPDNADYVIQSLGILGLMYFVFLAGVKMDLCLLKKVDKKHWCIATIGVFVPLFCSAAVAFAMRKSLDKEVGKASSIWGITSSLAITAFPVLYPIVKELNLLSSEMGRMALSTAVISDVIGMHGIVIFEASKQGETRPIFALWYIISLVVVTVSVVFGIRQAMFWIVRTTPEGKPVDQIYVIVILLSVSIAGFLADMFGLAIANGSLWLGLVVPDGPLLGAIIVEKSETIVKDILMPFSFMYVGMLTDFSCISENWSHLKPLVVMVLVGYTIKMLSTFVTARFLDLTIRDSLTLSLIVSLRGEVELLLFMHWMDFKIIGIPQFTALVLSSLLVTAVATPLISILYDPTRPYMVNKRRNIQHTPPHTELHIVACIQDEENLTGLMTLLELANPTINGPFCVYALCLVELIGRANPLFIDHEKEEEEGEKNNSATSLDQSYCGSIHQALKIFRETKGEHIRIHSYTAVAPQRSIYQDICELALSKQACLIVVPLNKTASDVLKNSTNVTKQGYDIVSSNVLNHAPCSVGILMDKSPYRNLVQGATGTKATSHHFVVLFLGGADAREALSFADRAAANRDISLTVIRFLAHEGEGDDAFEKKLDDALVTWFWVKNEGNRRIVYREVVVKNGEETIAAIRAMNDESYELWIVGRKYGINHVLLQGLISWSENTELGVIGEFVASEDFGSKASVLAVQQQILRSKDNSSSGCWLDFSWCTKRK